MRVVAALLGSDLARVMLSRMAVEVLARVSEIGVYLGSAVLAHLLLLLVVGLRWERRSRIGAVLSGVMRMHWWSHAVRHAA